MRPKQVTISKDKVSLQLCWWHNNIFILTKFWRDNLKLSNGTHLILNWFRINSMVANPSKFQIMFLGSNIDNSKIIFMIENKRVKSRSKVQPLGITKDNKLSFTIHIENLCSTGSNRLQALARIRKCILFEQAKRLSEAYIMITFTYCPLIWMYRSKTANNLIKKSINTAFVLYMKWKMQISKIY